MKLFRKLPPPIILGSEFGAPLNPAAVLSAFHRRKDEPIYRATGQMLLALREQCIVEADEAARLGESALASYQLGAANACVTVVGMLKQLQGGVLGDGVKEWFAENTCS